MSILIKLVQPLKALWPMVVTVLGMEIEVRLVSPENAEVPISMTDKGIIVFLHPAIKVLEAVSIMALQLLRESYFGLPLATIMLLSSPQFLNG